MNQKLMLVLAMVLVAAVALAQNTGAASPIGQGPTDLNGGMLSQPNGGPPGAGPNNQSGPGLGRHDLLGGPSGTTPLGCETCHLPHTSPTYGTSFMWAWKNLPATLNTYSTQTNSGGALTAPPSGPGQYIHGPTGNARSMLCFSCHDAFSVSANGVTAANVFGAGAALPYPLTNSGVSPNGLTTQHPVDAIFPPAAAGDYVQPQPLGAYGAYGATATVGIDALPLWDSAYHVECGTCHDVHNDYTVNNGNMGGIPFLRVANTYGTYLCRECHNAQ